MPNCEKCGRKLKQSQIKEVAPGKLKGDSEITEKKILCSDCWQYRTVFTPLARRVFEKIVMLEQQGEHEEALKKLDYIFDSTNPGLWYKKAELLAHLGELADALECYEEALFLDTHLVKAWYKKGWILFHLEKFEDAVKAFDNVLELERTEFKFAEDKWTHAAMFGKIFCLEQLKRLDEAITVFQELHKMLADLPHFKNLEFKGFKEFILSDIDRMLRFLEPTKAGAVGFSNVAGI
ncbi:MAG: tetratricopeptide repeat protein [Candidatus Diapherotrites archaeon]|nr:tetratricopeptide repeat protein [Candidatus Diapherotrites archaeon]